MTTKPQSTTETLGPCSCVCHQLIAGCARCDGQPCRVTVSAANAFADAAAIAESCTQDDAARDEPFRIAQTIREHARQLLDEQVSPASAAPVVDEHLLPQTDYKNKPQLDQTRRYQFGHLFHEYTFNNCDHGEQAGRVCKGCVVECLAYLAQRRATATATAVQRTFKNTKEAMLYAQRNNIPVVVPVGEPSTSARAAAEEIVPECLSRTCFIRDCGYDHCWGCEDSTKERERVAAIIERHCFPAAESEAQ